jgi:hypothetical protein
MSAQTFTITPARTSVAARPWLSLVIRGALAILALWLLHYAFSREIAWSTAHVAAFNKWDMGGWTYWLGMAALAGLAFGLAGSMPWPLTPIRYRWSRLVLAAVAALPHRMVHVRLRVPLASGPQGGWMGGADSSMVRPRRHVRACRAGRSRRGIRFGAALPRASRPVSPIEGFPGSRDVLVLMVPDEEESPRRVGKDLRVPVCMGGIRA